MNPTERMDPKIPRSRRSAEIIADNDDLLTELILLHLPARSLIKFKSVSKHWESLISAPSLAVAHTNHPSCRRRRSETLPSFMLGTIAKSPEFFYFNPTTKVFLPHTFEHPDAKILQSSHGLLLLECSHIGEWRRRVKHYCVYNPTTRKSRRVDFDKNGGGDGDGGDEWGLSLSFDPSISPYYRIIRTRRTDYYLLFEIYQSEVDRWQHMKYHRTMIDVNFWKGLSCSNGIYWIRPTSQSYYFDVETRRLKRLSGIFKVVPRRIRLGRKTSNKNYIMGSNGHVHCVSTYFGFDCKHLILYELSLADHNSGWVEKYWAELNSFSVIKGRLVGLLGIVRGDKEEDSSVLLHMSGMIVCYWFFDKRFEVLCNFAGSKIYEASNKKKKHLISNIEDELQFETKSCYQFIESLAPV